MLTFLDSALVLICFKARHKVQQIFAALKQVDINDETELDDYSVEIDILHQCRHKNIVGLHEAYFFGGKLWVNL